MQLPELLIEYFISGSLSMIWLFPLLSLLNLIPERNVAPLLVLFIPALYVLGAITDFLGRLLIRKTQKKIYEQSYQKLDWGKNKLESSNSAMQEAILTLYSTELARNVRMRNSRQRIARSTIVNFIFGSVIAIFIVIKNGYEILIIISTVFICSLLIFLSIVMWRRYQRSTQRFRLISILAIEDKLNLRNSDETTIQMINDFFIN